MAGGDPAGRIAGINTVVCSKETKLASPNPAVD